MVREGKNGEVEWFQRSKKVRDFLKCESETVVRERGRWGARAQDFRAEHQSAQGIMQEQTTRTLPK